MIESKSKGQEILSRGRGYGNCCNGEVWDHCLLVARCEVSSLGLARLVGNLIYWYQEIYIASIQYI